jgi:prevent-host-death family protein
MRTTGVAQLKAHLSRYLALVKSGQEVVVTERGRPVAKLVPLPAAADRASRRERLIREGVLLPGRGRLRPELLRPPKGPRFGDAVLKALLEERREGR